MKGEAGGGSFAGTPECPAQERNQRKSGVEGHYEYPAGEQTQGSGLELHWHNSCSRREVDKAVREVHGDSRMWTGQGGG